MKTRVAQCAKAIKQELKQLYPQVKFSVTSENFSMGNAVDVRFTDSNVLTEDVTKALAKYKSGHFDGMTDCYEYSNSRDDIPQTKFLHVQRYMSQEAKEIIAQIVAEKHSTITTVKALLDNELNTVLGEWGSALIHREFYRTRL